MPILDPDLELEDPELHFRMAQEGDFAYPCCAEFDSKDCRKAWANGHCPGASVEKCLTDPAQLDCGQIQVLLQPYRDTAKNKHYRDLLYRYMQDQGLAEAQARRAAEA